MEPINVNSKISRSNTNQNTNLDEDHFRNGIQKGDRQILAKSITFIESKNPSKKQMIYNVLASIPENQETLRIAVSGPPGVGKSTFIESFGKELIQKGFRIAVLAVDPSSSLGKGSILGDKTRMSKLSLSQEAFIRPSPNNNEYGGVKSTTFDSIKLCEAAGFNVILIETVGVGQSEYDVHKITDLFILLQSPTGGDELQGIKRGILEIADIILVNKCDGDLTGLATQKLNSLKKTTKLRNKLNNDVILAKISALEGTFIRELTEKILDKSKNPKFITSKVINRNNQKRDIFVKKVLEMCLDKIQLNVDFKNTSELMTKELSDKNFYNVIQQMDEYLEKKFKF